MLSSVLLPCRYAHEWEKTVRRCGRWIDFRNDYKTLNLEFMESVWWVFGQLHKQGLLYKGQKVRYHALSKVHCKDRETCSDETTGIQNSNLTCCATCLWWTSSRQIMFAVIIDCLFVPLQVMPYSTGLSTTLSNNEAAENYKDAQDPAVMV